MSGMNGDQPPRPKLFVSYAHADETDGGWKSRLLPTLKALRTGGIVDFFEDEMIAVGDEWDERLRRELDAYDLVIFLVSTAFLASGYIESVEVRRALERHESKQAHILPILVKPCDWTYRDWAKVQAFPRYGPDARPLSFWEKQGELDDALTQISQHIRAWAKTWQARQPLRTSDADIPKTPPYRGLLAFQPEHEADFFGREALTDTLWAAICNNRLTLLTGASGSGKSSLVNAGIIPRLDPNQWCIARTRPGETPIDNLAHTLARAMLPSADTFMLTDKAKELAAKLAKEPTLVLDYAATHKDQHRKALFLFIDQFEETFNLAKTKNPAQHGALTDLLLAISRGSETSPVTALLALRSDFMTAFQDDRPELVEALQPATVMMRRMKPDEWAAAIEGPARRRNVTVEPSLLATLVDEVAHNPDALPLLETTLETLWSSRTGDTLTLEAYKNQDGLAGALASRGETALADPGIDEATARRLFLQLVNVDPKGGIDTVTRQPRSRSHLDSVDPALWELGQILASEQHRLLVTSRDRPSGTEILDIIHESLFRQWRRLREWIENDRDLLFFRQQLEGRIADFDRSNRDPGYYLPEGEIPRARDWLSRHPDAFSTEQQGFIDATIEHWDDNFAERRAKELWANIDFRSLDSGEPLDEDEYDTLEHLSRSDVRTRAKFLFLAITEYPYARKFNRQPNLVIRSTLQLDKSFAHSFSHFSDYPKLDLFHSAANFAKFTLLLQLLPIAPELASHINKSIMLAISEPLDPTLDSSQLIFDATAAIAPHLDRTSATAYYAKAMDLLEQASHPLEAAGPIKIISSVINQLDSSYLNKSLLSYFASLEFKHLSTHFEQAFSLAQCIIKGKADAIDDAVAERLLAIIQGAQDFHSYSRIFALADLVVKSADTEQIYKFRETIKAQLLHFAEESANPFLFSLAEIVATCPRRFRHDDFYEVAAAIFERCFSILASSDDSAEFRTAIFTVAKLLDHYTVAEGIVANNESALKRAEGWASKSRELGILIALEKLSRLKTWAHKEYNPFHQETWAWGWLRRATARDISLEVNKLSDEAIEHLIDTGKSSDYINVFRKLLDGERDAYHHVNPGCYRFLHCLIDPLDSLPIEELIFVDGEPNIKALSFFFRHADRVSLLMAITAKLDSVKKEKIIDYIFDRGELIKNEFDRINERSIISILEENESFFNAKRLDRLCDLLFNNFSNCVFEREDRLADLLKVYRLGGLRISKIPGAAVLFLSVETLKRPFAGHSDVTRNLLATISGLLTVRNGGSETVESWFWRVIHHLAELKAAHPDWDWLDLARPPLPPDELVATFRRLCADPPDWPTT